MHTDLTLHLHSDDCGQFIRRLMECHEKHPYGKFFGVCNDEDLGMRSCLKRERLDKQKRNFQDSMEYKRRQRTIEETTKGQQEGK